MGLDMYLRAQQHVFGYEFESEQNRETYSRLLDLTGLRGVADPNTPSADVSVIVAYWRKANAIHRWFVENVQGGEDDCKEHYVSREKLEELRDVCTQVIAASELVSGAVCVGQTMGEDGQWQNMMEEGEVVKDPSVAQEHLPTASGSFFGSTDYDKWYIEDLKNTVEQIDRVLANVPEDANLVYRSSW